MQKIITEKAYAKVNLGMQIVNKRSDGFHNLKMLMTTIDLYDNIEIYESKDVDIVMSKNICSLEDNIIYKTIMYMKEKFNIDKNVTVVVEKNIPSEAGLGGGSADAAAVIRGLNKLWKLNMSISDMIDVGKNIGSDVAFCIYKHPAIVTGKGEIITPLRNFPKLDMALIVPKFKTSTKDAYLNHKIIPDDERFENLTNHVSDNTFCDYLFNDFEVDIKNSLIIAGIKNELIKNGCNNAVLSGSGSAIIGIMNDSCDFELLKKNMLSDKNIESVYKVKNVNAFIL